MDLSISIHTSAREVTQWRVYPSTQLDISIHTSAREVTTLALIAEVSDKISIHTSAREVTECLCYIGYKVNISIHTSAREVTISWHFPSLIQQISIHTSAREVTAIFHKNICLFLWNIYKYIWIYFRILLKYSVYTKSTFKFVYFYRCESPGNFMYARHSHLQIIRIKADRLQFLVLHLYALSWSYNYFQDSRIASYLLYHQ